MLQLHTERLAFRPLAEGDWPLFLRLHQEPKTMQYVFGEIAEADVRRGFEHRLPAWSPKAEHWLCLVARDAASEQEVGVAGLRILAPGHAELGTLLLPECQGRGYGVECCQVMVDLARRIGLVSLESTVTDGNLASSRVMEKCGFVLEKRMPRAYRIGEQWFDDLVYGYSVAGRAHG